MTKWNYRIIRIKQDRKYAVPYIYEIREVYYNMDQKPDLWGEKAVSLSEFEYMDEVEDTVKLISLAVNKPVLEEVTRDGKVFLEEV